MCKSIENEWMDGWMEYRFSAMSTPILAIFIESGTVIIAVIVIIVHENCRRGKQNISNRCAANVDGNAKETD